MLVLALAGLASCGDNLTAFQADAGFRADASPDSAPPAAPDSAVPQPDAAAEPLPPGNWEPAGGGFVGMPCIDGIRFAAAGDKIFACTTTNGFQVGTVADDRSVTWTSMSTGIENLEGRAIAVHPTNTTTFLYVAAPRAGLPNWYRTNDAAAGWFGELVPNTDGTPREVFAARIQPMVGNMLGSWAAPQAAGAAPQAAILAGGGTLAARPVATATGTVRAFAGSAPTNLYAVVYGQTPEGTAATGGIFHSADRAITWTARDTGIAAADKDRVFSITIDPNDPLILYASLRGGGRIYKTVDGGTSWTAAASGLPANAEVVAIAVSPHDSQLLYAATSAGLYMSSNGGGAWRLDGLGGRAVHAVAISPVAADLVLVGVADAVGLYQPL